MHLPSDPSYGNGGHAKTRAAKAYKKALQKMVFPKLQPVVDTATTKLKPGQAIVNTPKGRKVVSNNSRQARTARID